MSTVLHTLHGVADGVLAAPGPGDPTVPVSGTRGAIERFFTPKVIGTAIACMLVAAFLWNLWTKLPTWVVVGGVIFLLFAAGFISFTVKASGR